MTKVTIEVNGKKVSKEVADHTILSVFLRDNLNLTGTHVGCDTSQCGACVVHVDGKSVDRPAIATRGRMGAFYDLGLDRDGPALRCVVPCESRVVGRSPRAYSAAAGSTVASTSCDDSGLSR